ncbi:MAG: Druantia anti-phage system protein DruA, partial [Thiohalocapsa sp.]
MNLREIVLQGGAAFEEERFQALIGAHHYLRALPKIGHTLWYVATCNGEWLALLSFSAAAWKCAARDTWIGWDFRRQYDRLHLIANNSRFLILPEHHVAKLASRVLALSVRRLAQDWRERFGYPLLLLEAFVDPQRFHGMIYRAANWRYVGNTHGYRRTRHGYSTAQRSAKRVFVRPLHAHAQACLSRPILDPQYRHGAPKIMLSVDQVVSLPGLFAEIPDPRRGQGRRHPLPAVLAIAAGATLCG